MYIHLLTDCWTQG